MLTEGQMIIKLIYKDTVSYVDLMNRLLKKNEGIPLLGFGFLLDDCPVHFFF